MSSYFDDASLVMIPSGYKTSKVYSVKPTDGTGDLTFTRSNSTASRVASNGLIEKVRTNLALQSQNFSSGSWLVLNATKVSTANTDPNGGNTACNVTWGAGTSSYLYGSVAQTGYHTVSMWVKSNGGGNNFRLFGDGTALNSANFTATTSWQRFSFAFNAAGGSSWGIRNNSTQDAADLLVAFAQLETGDIATDYIATTTAAVSVGPVANVPRLDYLGSTCPKLQLEPSRTNIQLNSEDFSQSNWSKTNSAVVTNQVASPDGYVNADKLNETAVNNIHQLESSRSVSSSTAYTMSVFAKKAERSWIRIYEDTTQNSAYFNLDSGTVGTVSGPTAVAKIENYGNGWYRCSVTYTETGTFGRYRITTAKQDDEASYLGVANNGIYVWGAQYEAGAYATSYIPTLGAAVTRGAEQVAKTSVSTLIGQSEGTLFVEANLTNLNASNAYLLQVSESGSNRFFIYRDSAQKLGCFALIGSSAIYQTLTASAVTGTAKAAFAYKNGSFAFYVNGVQVGTSAATFTTPPTMGRVDIDANTGGENGFYTYAQALLFKTRLTNADLAALTA